VQPTRNLASGKPIKRRSRARERVANEPSRVQLGHGSRRLATTAAVSAPTHFRRDFRYRHRHVLACLAARRPWTIESVRLVPVVSAARVGSDEHLGLRPRPLTGVPLRSHGGACRYHDSCLGLKTQSATSTGPRTSRLPPELSEHARFAQSDSSATAHRTIAGRRACRTSRGPRPVVVKSSKPDATSRAALTSTWRHSDGVRVASVIASEFSPTRPDLCDSLRRLR
jgi:hypothetical protein